MCLLHAGRNSCASVGASMSLGNWLPVQQNHLAPSPYLGESPEPYPPPHLHGMLCMPQPDVALQNQQRPAPQSCELPHMHRMHSVTQPDIARQNQQMLRSQGKQAQTKQLESSGQGNGDCSMQQAANRRRRQCLLEIERELMRSSSSDEEEGNNMHRCSLIKKLPAEHV